MSICRKPYPSDVSTEERSLIAPYLLLQRKDAGQREYDLREVFTIADRHLLRKGDLKAVRKHLRATQVEGNMFARYAKDAARTT